MTIEDIAFVGWVMAIIAIIINFFQWLKSHNLSKENLKLNNKNLELETLKLAPQINITYAYVDYEKGDTNALVKAGVDNSGEGNANFPEWTWKLTFKNRTHLNMGKWEKIIIKGGLDISGYQEFSYLKGLSPEHSLLSSFSVNNPEKELDILELHIMIRYTDCMDESWISKATFNIGKEGWKVRRRWLEEDRGQNIYGLEKKKIKLHLNRIKP